MIKYLLAACVAVSGCASYDMKDTTGRHVVIDNEGGMVSRFKRSAFFMDKVALYGDCMSACTVFLKVGDVCIDDTTTFHFHRATYRVFGGGYRKDPIATSMMYRSYPNWVKEWVDAQGGLQKDWIVMSNEYASQYLPHCNEEDVTDE